MVMLRRSVNLTTFSGQTWFKIISLYKLQAETYNAHYNNNTEHLYNRDSEESQNDFCNPSPR